LKRMAIEAVILDWGGVLIENPGPGLMGYCADVLGVSCREYTEVHDALVGPFQEGRISEQEFWASICARLSRGIPSRSSLWGEAFRAVYTPRPEMLALVRDLRQGGCKTALLSNTEPPCVRYFQELGYDMFDVQVFSCTAGVRKPDARIYELAIDRLGVARDRAVFVDDNPMFVEGAKGAGLLGITFHNRGRLVRDLAALGCG
jgi:epoxide hydrolase-like predicted phosphatase